MDPRQPCGRDAELAAVDAFLDGGRDGLRALVLEGAPGIGKTTLWREAVARAEARGLTVLSCRPVETEAKLGFASLADLVAPVVDRALPSLPEPQRAALEVALLYAAPAGAGPDRRAVGTAVRSVLRGAAAEGPLLVAVDDVQWLDRASASALSFALRRLHASPILVLVALRLEPGGGDPLDLERAAPDGFTRLRLGPLTLSGLYHAIREQLGEVFPRPTLQRIAQASGGNPLLALELARALGEAGARPLPGEPLPVPETLGALMEGRIRRLPAASREAVLVAASVAGAHRALVAGVVGDRADDALAAAERAGVVAIAGDRVRFTHPLLASAAYAAAPAESRRDVHRKLAGIVAEPEEQARHRALGAAGPDESVAAALDEAARRANGRGAPEAAAELAELACRLTPPERGEDRLRRTVELAEYEFRAGDTTHAQQLVESVRDGPASGPLRARALELAARILHVAGTSAEAVTSCEEALAIAGGDPQLRARIHATLAQVCWHDFGLALEHARAAVDLLDGVADPDPGTLSLALAALVEAEFYAGRGLRLDTIERALELERVAPAPRVADRVSASLGALLKYQGDFEGARVRLDEAYRTATEEGDEASLAYVVGHLPQLELWTGDWPAADRHAVEHLELADATGQADQRRQALFNLAIVHAHAGRADEARTEAEQLLAEAEAADDGWGASNALAAVGLLELSLGDAPAAAARLERNLELREAMGATEPMRAQGDLVEALVETGELGRAAEISRLLDERADAAGRSPMLAIAARARALVAAARGDLDEAAADCEEALAQHERAPIEFEAARTLLVLGRIRRRRGERRAARDALEQARASFEQLGAPLWAERAAAELRRVPIRRRASEEELTPTEERVAELAAAGRTNLQVAQALFVSPKTVEANLTRVYRKLGVRSRAELGATMALRRNEGDAAKT